MLHSVEWAVWACAHTLLRHCAWTWLRRQPVDGAGCSFFATGLGNETHVFGIALLSLSSWQLALFDSYPRRTHAARSSQTRSRNRPANGISASERRFKILLRFNIIELSPLSLLPLSLSISCPPFFHLKTERPTFEKKRTKRVRDWPSSTKASLSLYLTLSSHSRTHARTHSHSLSCTHTLTLSFVHAHSHTLFRARTLSHFSAVFAMRLCKSAFD